MVDWEGIDFSQQPTLISPNQTPAGSVGDSSGTPWWGSLITAGLATTQSILQYKTLNNQISHGQIPSTGYDPKTGLIAGQNLSSSVGGIGFNFWVLGGVAVVLLMLARR